MEINKIKKNRQIVEEALKQRAEARRIALRREEEKHAKFEREMIRSVNENNKGHLQMHKVPTMPAVPKHEAVKAVTDRSIQKALERVAAEGNDWLLKVWICGGAIVVTRILQGIGVMTSATATVLITLLVLFIVFCICVLYEISGVVAELHEEEE